MQCSKIKCTLTFKKKIITTVVFIAKLLYWITLHCADSVSTPGYVWSSHYVMCMSGCVKPWYETRVVLPVETVCRKLCVHPAQPDVPTGGRGSSSVQQDHSFGQDCQQEPGSGWHWTHRLLQSTEQNVRTRSKMMKMHNRNKHTYWCRLKPKGYFYFWQLIRNTRKTISTSTCQIVSTCQCVSIH